MFIRENRLLLVDRSIINSHFQRVGLIDEPSLAVAPIIADVEDKPLFMNSTVSDFEIKGIKQHKNSVVRRN